MTAEREGLAEIAGVLYAHGLEVEHRAYPAYACACEKWDGAMGDNGGTDDGRNDTELGHARHVADALADLLAARDRRVRAEAVRDLAAETLRMPADPAKVAQWLRDRADRIEAER